jgi:predicted RND superfamily exporter protein
MKRLFRIFEISKNEQRVVLIVMLILIVVSLIGYERRVHRVQVRTPSVPDLKTSPRPVQTDDTQ